VTILSKYLVKQHLVPFVFALSACTSIMILNQIAKRLPDLVGKGLPWSVIVEVFALSVPFVVAMTIPMAVLVAVLYTVSYLAAENELTALRAGGVSTGRLMRPLLLGGLFMTVLAFLFSDQVLPRSNHRLKTLLTDIARTKPTFNLEEQVINEVQRDRFFIRANRINPATFEMEDVTIYDLTNPARKRTIYADRGMMGFGADRQDLFLTLYDGTSHETLRQSASQFQQMNFRQQIIRVEGIGGAFSRSERDLFKGDREMSVCEMDSVIAVARRESRYAERRADGIELNSLRGLVGLAPVPIDSTRRDATPGLYCRAVETVTEWLGPEAAEAQEQGSDSGATALGVDVQAAQPPQVTYTAGNSPNARSAHSLHDRSRSGRIRAANYLVEVHKKYAMATASLVFVLVGVPVAIRFPRSGVGLVIGVSLGVFTIYYVGLIGGESLGNQLKVPAAWAMWTPNIVFTILGLAGLRRIRTRSTTPRGGTSLAWGLRTTLLRGRPRP
jgi:lipopolysaccharide export system permease protein